MAMSDVIGHDRVKALLENSIKSARIGHAYIFEGNEGVGRLTLAKVFAEEITGGASAENNPDITIVTNELYDSSKKQTNVLIDTIRAMKTDIYIKPYIADKKVYIIPNADTMLSPAQNSLLKVFEEPPEYAVIILIAKNSNAFLPTILSRATRVRLMPLEKNLVENYLIKKSVDDEKAKTLSVMSGGSIGKALKLCEDEEAISLRQQTVEHLMNIQTGGNKPLYDFIKFLKQNKSSCGIILDIISGFSRDVLNIKMNSFDIENADIKEDIKKFSLSVTKEAAFRLNEIAVKYMRIISSNANYPIAVSCMATELWEEIHGRNYRSAL